jgi:succinoglycan biosynthesis transport protein ExoP
MDVAMNERQIISLRPYVDVLYRHRVSFLCALAVGLSLTAYALVMLPQGYRSSALLLEEPPEVAPSYIAAPAATDVRDRVEFVTQVALSRRRLARIIRAFNLYPRQRAAHEPIDELADRMRRRIAVDPVVDPQRPGEPPDAFEVSFEYPVAALAQAVTARLSAMFVNEDRSRRIAAAAVADRFLRDQVAGARASLEAKSSEIKTFKKRYAGALPEEMASNLQQLERLQEQLDLTVEALARAQVVSPQTRLGEMEGRLITLRARYSDAYPDVVALRDEIDALKRSRAAPVRHPNRSPSDGARVLGDSSRALDGDSALDSARTMDTARATGAGGLQARRAALLGQIASARERIAETPEHEQQLAALERDYGVLADNYARLMRRRLQARATMLLAQRDEGARLRVADPANLPLRPARPNSIAILVLGAIVSLAGAIALPFGIFFTDTSFKDPDELAREHGSPVLIAIPELKEIAGRRERLRNGLGAGAAAFAALSIGAAALWMYAARVF